MNYIVEYVELKNGKKPFEEFILNLPIKESISKHLEDGIFELRTSFAKRIARSIYFYQKGAKIILTHGFIKKTAKTPRKEIERAKELWSLYHKEKEKK